MPFTGDEGKIKTRAEARGMIQQFQASAAYQKVKGGFYGKNKLLDLLKQANCVGMRYYFASDSTGQPTIVLVGEDNAGNCLSDGVLIEDGPVCPPFCPGTNALDA